MNSPRDLVRIVLIEAVGSSVTPFVPVPFVDDYLFARLLRRIARKVMIASEVSSTPEMEKAIVEGYLREGDTTLGAKALTAAARFVIRKVAVVLDVKRSHDVFGEAIVFALALDVAAALGAVQSVTALSVGGAIHRASQTVGSATIEVLTRAGRDAFKASEGAADGNRFTRVAEAIGRHVDVTRAHLDPVMRFELVR